MAGDEETVGAGSGTGTATATATPAPVAPSQPGEMPQPVSTLPATAPQIAREPVPEMDDVYARHMPYTSFGAKLYHGVLNALGGSHDVTFERDVNSGKMVAHVAESSPGTQWKRIISGALTGFAGAQAAGTQGPGGSLRGFAGGIQAGSRMAAQGEQKARGEADENYKAQLENATNNLRNSLLSQQVAESQWRVQQGKQQADQDDVDRYNAAQQIISAGGPGTEEVGVFKDFADYIAHTRDNPEAHKDQVEGRFVAIPNIGQDGKKSGVQVWRVTPDWASSKTIKDTEVPTRKADGTWTTTVIPAQGATNGQVMQWLQAGAVEKNKEDLQQQEQDLKKKQESSEEGLRKSEEAEHYAAADKDRKEATALNQANDQNTINNNAMQLVEGSMDPSNLSKRSKTYDATLAAATSYSMSKYGKPFDVAKASSDYKYATNVQTANTLKYLNSLTGRDNQSGNLGTVINLSDKLERTTFPAVNNAEQWVKLQAGNPQVAAYYGALVEVSDQIAKVLQGGGSGNGTTDAKLEQAQQLLNKNFNPDQMKAVATTLRELLGNRKREMIGDNRYLMQWQGPPAAPAPSGGGGKAPVSLAAARQLPINQGKTDEEISADIKAHGYEVGP